MRPGPRPAAPAAGATAEAQTSPQDGGRSPGRRTWSWWKAAAFTVAAAAVFCVYLRLSNTSALNSDSANYLLMGSDLLHGNLLLHGWYMSDVSVYTTELPQYALLESFLGLHAETAHVAAAMTYTLATVLAVLLAKGGTSGRTALTRMLIAAGIMVAPQLGLGVYTFTMVVDHIGTSVPLLALWLLLDRVDRSSPRWWVPVLTSLLLAWVLIADPIVLVVAVAPLALVSGIRFIQGVVADDGQVSSGWTRRVRKQWYPLCLACAAATAIIWARLAEWLLSALGAFAVHPVPFVLTPLHQARQRYVAALWKVLQLFGADYRGLVGLTFVVAVLHLVSVALVGWSMLRVARRFLRVPLVDQVLAVAILANVVLYVVSGVSQQGPHEIAVVMPFGAALAARTLIRRASHAPRPGERRAAGGNSISRVRLAGYAAGVLVLAGYLAGLGYELTKPAVPPQNSALVPWLTAHHLTYGLGGYWQASSVTVASDGRVAIRGLAGASTRPYLWLAKTSWYDPASHRATFVVIDTQAPASYAWLPQAAVERYFGPPVRTYHTGAYTILVWDKNLLRDIPGAQRAVTSR
jgi:hypothetical protein